MVFVQKRHGGDEREGDEPPLSTQPAPRRSTEGPRGQKREHRVFGEVRRLAHEEVDFVNPRISDAGEEPQQKRAYDERRIRGRETRGRGEEYEARPRHQRAVAPQTPAP